MSRITDSSGRTVLEAKIEGHRVIDDQLAATMRTMLHAVTQKGGTAEGLSLPGYTFAGKTGTAQKVDPATRRYSAEKWVSSFVGFAPLEHPRLVIYVMIDEPQGTHYGSKTAGPVFQEVMLDALRWLGVPPDAPIALAKKAAGEVVKPATLPILPPTPTVALAETSDTELGGEAAGGEGQVPDFTGMSIGEALEAARAAGIRVEVVGSGYASGQSPGPGATARGVPCKVAFTPPG
jgi:cell division protein FtsI (penicillin-binding protein 3)